MKQPDRQPYGPHLPGSPGTPGRPAATHVQSAVARPVQGRIQVSPPRPQVPPPAQKPAAHVQAAVGTAQARLPGGHTERQPAAHVQAALGALQPKGAPADRGAGPAAPGVVQRMQVGSSSSHSASGDVLRQIQVLATECGVVKEVTDILKSGKLRNLGGLLALLQQIRSTGDLGFRYELYYAWRQVTKPGKAHEIQLGEVGGVGGDVVVFRGPQGKRDKTLQIKYVTGSGKKTFKGNLLLAAAQLGGETGNNEVADPRTIRTVEMVITDPNLPEASLGHDALAQKLGEYLGPSPKIQNVDRVRLRINQRGGGHNVHTFGKY